jgi:TonB family protein
MRFILLSIALHIVVVALVYLELKSSKTPQATLLQGQKKTKKSVLHTDKEYTKNLSKKEKKQLIKRKSVVVIYMPSKVVKKVPKKIVEPIKKPIKEDSVDEELVVEIEEVVLDKKIEKNKIDAKSSAQEKESETNEEEENRKRISGRYYSRIKNSLTTTWTRPIHIKPGENITTLVSISLNKDGVVTNIKVVRSSGDSLFDRSVIASIRKIGKFGIPKDPKIYQENFSTFKIEFTNPEE